MSSQDPLRISIIAAPPKRVTNKKNGLIDEIAEIFKQRQVELLPADSVLAIDLLLGALIEQHPERLLSVQIIGHAMSGVLYLGASWLEDSEIHAKRPFYILDTNPAALGLLSKYAGHVADLTLVGCNVGAVSSYGYAINGRTLTYTLAEVLQCPVRGADDEVSPDEFDGQGVYSPASVHRKPTGWKWEAAGPPQFIAGSAGVTPPAAPVARQLMLVEVTGTRLPIEGRTRRRRLATPIPLYCRKLNDPRTVPRFALPEVNLVATERSARHPAKLLAGGRYLKLDDGYYAVDFSAELSSGLTRALWGHDSLIQRA